jgi:hypothetical protein
MKHFQEEDLTLVHAYLAGHLDTTEKTAFEQRLANNPALQQELEVHKAIFVTLEQQEDQRLKALMRNTKEADWEQIQQAFLAEDKPIRRLNAWPWALAASILLLLGFLSWRYFIHSEPSFLKEDQLALENLSGEFDELRAAKVILVPADQPDYKVERTIVGYYNQGKYELALQELEKLPERGVTLFHQAKCLLALHREREAIALLKKVERFTAETYSNTAQWLLAVAYFQLGDKGLAKEYAGKVLKNEGIEDQEREMAREMLKRLK